MAEKKESFFWTSYSDLMTSLFFIMLVLFVLVIVLLHKRMETTERQLEEIKKIENSTKDLSKDYFEYNKSYKKYVLKVKTFFPVNQHDIRLLSEPCRKDLLAAGKEISDFLKRHSENQYLLIIEGQASKNSELMSKHNYDLSFQRAQSLIRFWLDENKLNFGDNCEIQIAGSGDGRLNKKSMRDTMEVNNQRFLIHILPKNIMNDEKM